MRHSPSFGQMKHLHRYQGISLSQTRSHMSRQWLLACVESAGLSVPVCIARVAAVKVSVATRNARYRSLGLDIGPSGRGIRVVKRECRWKRPLGRAWYWRGIGRSSRKRSWMRWIRDHGQRKWLRVLRILYWLRWYIWVLQPCFCQVSGLHWHNILGLRPFNNY